MHCRDVVTAKQTSQLDWSPPRPYFYCFYDQFSLCILQYFHEYLRSSFQVGCLCFLQAPIKKNFKNFKHALQTFFQSMKRVVEYNSLKKKAVKNFMSQTQLHYLNLILKICVCIACY